MCKQKRGMMVMYKVIGERLQIYKDPWGMINHKEVQLCLCRLFHTPKQLTNAVINELIELGIIDKMGRNQCGLFYKVN